MLLFGLSLLIGFVVNVASGTVVAQLAAGPLTHANMAQYERQKKDLKMFPMLAGYFLMTLVMVLAYPYFSLDTGWLLKGAILGVFAGLISFVSVYAIISGWSVLPPKEMILSGLIDVVSTVLSGIAIAYIYTF